MNAALAVLTAPRYPASANAELLLLQQSAYWHKHFDMPPGGSSLRIWHSSKTRSTTRCHLGVKHGWLQGHHASGADAAALTASPQGTSAVDAERCCL